MSSRGNDHPGGAHYTVASSHEQAPTRPQQHIHVRLTRAAPNPDVVAAVEFLLSEPDAYLYRRRYLELITRTAGQDGTTITDYTAAEKYLLTAAAARRKEVQRPTTLYAEKRREPEDNT